MIRTAESGQITSADEQIDENHQGFVWHKDEALAVLNTLLTRAPIGFALFDTSLRYVLINDALVVMNGLPAEAHIGRTVQQVVPDLSPQVVEGLQRVLTTGEPLLDQLVIGETSAELGKQREWLTSYYPVVMAGGHTIGVGAVVVEQTERARADRERELLVAQLAAERARLEEVLRQMPAGVIIAEAPSGNLVLGNPKVEQIWRHDLRPVSEVAAYDQYHGFHREDGRPYLPEEWPLARSISTGEVITDEEIDFIRGDGSRGTLRVSSAPIRAEGNAIVAGVVTFNDVTERVIAEERQRFLAEASAVLGSSLEYKETLANVARLAVAKIADWCSVEILNADGVLEPVVVAHQDEAKVALARELRKRYPPDPNAPYGTPAVVQSGVSELVPEINTAMLEAAARDAEHLRILREARLASYMAVPLRSHGKTLGAILFVATDDRRRYGPDDLLFAEELARRAAVAVDNAFRYQAEQQARKAAERMSLRITRLQSITAALSQALTPEQVTEVIVDQAITALGAYAGSIVMLCDDGETLEVVRAMGYPQDVMKSWARFPLSQQVPLAEAVRTGQPLWMDDQAAVAQYPTVQNTLSRTSSKALAVVPLIIEERVIGAMGLSFAQPQVFGPNDQSYMLALTRQCVQALERARLYAAERAARARAEAMQERFSFLAETSAVLAASLDLETTINAVTHLVVPRLADWCTVDILEADGKLHQWAVAHRDPSLAAVGQEARQRYPVDVNAPYGIARVTQTGQAELTSVVTEAHLDALTEDPVLRRLLRTINITSYMGVPVIVRGRTLGVITFLATHHSRQYGPEDLALAEEVARRAATAIDNAHLYRESQQALQVRDQFLSVASHELKTPITAMMGFVQLLRRRAERDGGGDPRTMRTFNTLMEQGQRLNRLVSALLDFSRLQMGQFSVERRVLDLRDLVKRVSDEIQALHEDHSIVVNLGPQPLLIDGDELRLEQVVQNLMQNAVKYSPLGGIITVTLEKRDAHGCLSVSDRGIGIPKDAQPRLFERFFRAKNAQANQIHGLGIGLYVVKEIVEIHDGTIEVESAEGKGSTFTVQLPLQQAV